MKTQPIHGRRIFIAAAYTCTLVLLASIIWQPARGHLGKSQRLAGIETETAFLMERFGNPQRSNR